MKSNIDIKTSNQNIEYFDALNFMEKRVDKILCNEENEMLWFLNHNHVYTCGTSAKKNEILGETNIPILQTNRGGKTTYHGPGQRVVYFMINLNKRKKDIRKFVNVIENSVISLLKEFDIEATTFSERVGVWVIKSQGNKLLKEKKIGAIGLRIKKWITYHGLSFNIDPDLKFYGKVDACGLKDFSSTSLKDLCINLTNKEFDKMFKKKFNNELSQM
jgi:lipoyl(octanoyl) transferase